MIHCIWFGIDRDSQPFNAEYLWFNTTDNYNIVDPEITVLNPYRGGAFQQAISGLSETSKHILPSHQ